MAVTNAPSERRHDAALFDLHLAIVADLQIGLEHAEGRAREPQGSSRLTVLGPLTSGQPDRQAGQG